MAPWQWNRAWDDRRAYRARQRDQRSAMYRRLLQWDENFFATYLTENRYEPMDTGRLR